MTKITMKNLPTNLIGDIVEISTKQTTTRFVARSRNSQPSKPWAVFNHPSHDKSGFGVSEPWNWYATEQEAISVMNTLD